MEEQKDKYTREEALEEISKMAKEVTTKERKTKAIEFLSLLVTVLASILSTVGVSSELFKNDNLSKLIERPIFYWVVGLIFLLFITIAFTSKLLKWLSKQPTDKETLLKDQIISAFSNSLDKTILNPNSPKSLAS